MLNQWLWSALSTKGTYQLFSWQSEETEAEPGHLGWLSRVERTAPLKSWDLAIRQ